MRTLAWTAAVTITVSASVTVASQQPPARPAPAGGAVTVVGRVLGDRDRPGRGVSAGAVLDRILSFDANGDNRISRDELPERMENLLSRGDRNQDGVLTSDEIVPLIDLRASTAQRPCSVNVNAGASEGFAGVVADLKLPPATHNRAWAIVNAPRIVNPPANADFKIEMKEILNEEDYENYVAAAARLRRTPRVFCGNIRGTM